MDAANHNSTTLDLSKHPTSKTSSTTSSQFDINEAMEVMRNQPDFFDDSIDVFADETLKATSSQGIQPPARKMPRISSCEDMFADTPPVPTQGILTKFYGHYEPGVSPPETVRLQILDILESTQDGFISNTVVSFYNIVLH